MNELKPSLIPIVVVSEYMSDTGTTHEIETIIGYVFDHRRAALGRIAARPYEDVAGRGMRRQVTFREVLGAEDPAVKPGN